MIIGLWVLTGLVLITTLLAAFAIPSWPVAILLLLSVLASFLARIKAPPIVLKVLFGMSLVVVAYDVYRLVSAMFL
ncbi:hypothetical protein JZ785_02440 [Alicyclobacillus curvatus]|nr:hypothetical protein JZ785_02440 [Alicyclobacillus curvatus]